MDKKQALGRAMALCSRQEYSVAEMKSKLKFWGAEPGDIDDILEQLVQEKFLDDLRYTIAYARDKVRLNHWGRIKIRYMLSAEKIGSETIDRALDEIDVELYADSLLALLQKKARELKGESNPFTKRQKLIKFAQGRGFEVDLIIKQIKDLT
jgi:regulatory protein